MSLSNVHTTLLQQAADIRTQLTLPSPRNSLERALLPRPTLAQEGEGSSNIDQKADDLKKSDLQTPDVDAQALRKQVAELVVGKKSGEGRASTNAERLLADPSLKELHVVFEQVKKVAPHRNRSCTTLETDKQIAEAAVWVTRYLHKRDSAPTFRNMSEALEALDATRNSLAKLELFRERNILIGADNQFNSQIAPGQNTTIGIMREIRGDDFVFGSKEMLSLLTEASGPRGSVKLVRANASVERQLEEMLRSNVSMIAATKSGNDKKQWELIAHLGVQLRDALGPPADKQFKVGYGIDPDSPADAWVGKLFLRSGDKLFGEIEFKCTTTEKGQAIDLVTSTVDLKACKPLHSPKSPKDAETELLDKIATTPPGPNGFTLVLDGHGSPTLLSLSTDRLDGKGFPVASVFLTPEKLAKAFQQRALKFDTSKDIVMVSSCFSGDFIRNLSKELIGGKACPILCSTVEIGQFMHGSLYTESVDADLSRALQLRTGRNNDKPIHAILGDRMENFPKQLVAPVHNKTILVPEQSKGEKGKVVGYDQISQRVDPNSGDGSGHSA